MALGETRIRMFDPNGIVYYLGENRELKEDIEFSLNIQTVHIGTIQKLVQEIQDMKGSKVWTTFIFTDSISSELKGQLDAIIDTFSKTICVSLNASIIELGLDGKYFDSKYPNVFTYATVESLAKDKQYERRGRVVEKAKQEQNEYVAIYEGMLTEIDDLRDRYNRKSLEYETLKTERNKLSEIVNKLNNIESEYSNKLADVTSLLDATQDRNEELTAQLEMAEDVASDLRNQSATLLTKNSEMTMTIKANERILENIRAENTSNKRKIRSLEESIIKIKRERDNLITQQIDEEYIDELMNKIDQLERDSNKKDDVINEKDVLISTLKHESRRLESDIQLLRQSKEDIELKGKTDIIDKAFFRTTNVHYFKIKHELKYLKSYISTYIKILNDEFNGNVKVIILKNNEGTDDIYFDYKPIYQDLKEALDTGKKEFRLFPSASMFTGIEDFEQTVGHLVVLDFIDSSELYVSTGGFSRNYVVVIDSSLISKLKYSGIPISLDKYSVLDMSFDPEIAISRTNIKTSLLESKLRHFMTDKVQVL